MMTLTWYGHSCFKISDGEKSVVLDPYQPSSVPGLELPPICADYCFCSHNHHDHCYSNGVKLSGRKPIISQQKFQTFHDMNNGLSRGNNEMTMVELDNLRFLHMGDIGQFLSKSQLDELGRIDILMVPVGGFYTIDAKYAKQLKDELNPLVTIPMHYRGPGFGYDNIDTVDEFAKLCNDVVRLDCNSVENIENISSKCTLILSCPTKK